MVEALRLLVRRIFICAITIACQYLCHFSHYQCITTAASRAGRMHRQHLQTPDRDKQAEADSDCSFRHAICRGRLELGILFSIGITPIERRLLPQKEQKQSRMGCSTAATESSMISFMHTLRETFALFSPVHTLSHYFRGFIVLLGDEGARGD